MVKSVLCTASAGAGKTYRLTQEVFQRIQAPDRFVVAVTFTRAAAAEMERRLLEEILSGEKTPKDPGAKLTLIMRASKVHFSTLDSLFYLFLSTESYVPQIADEHEISLIHRRAEVQFFQNPFVLNKLSLLVILARILNIEPEKLTTILSEESAFLLEWSCTEEELQAFRKQQEVLKNQFLQYQKQVEEVARIYNTKEELKTLHRQIINHLLKPLEMQPAGCIIRCQDLDDVGKDSGSIPEAQRNTEAYASLKEIYPSMRGILAEYILNTQKLRAALLRQFALAYSESLKEEKSKARRIFFEDVAQELANLDGGKEARERPHLMARLYELGFHSVTDLFLDEFQDTSRIQLELLRPLIEEILGSVDQRAEGKRSIFLVGDWKQSIYQWRDAEPQVLLDWSRMYRQRGQLAVDLLSYNWRSTPLLIGFFNNLVKNLFAGTEQEKELQAPPPRAKQRAPYRGYSKVEVVPVACKGSSDEPLYQQILDEVRKLKEQGVPYGDITILCRTHSHIKNVTETLAQANIYTASIKGREVLSTREGMALYLAIARVFASHTSKVRPLPDPEVSDRPENGTQEVVTQTALSTSEVSPHGQDYIDRALTFLGYGETLLPLARECAEEMSRLQGPHRFSSLAKVLSVFEPHLPRVVVEAVWTWGEEYFQYEEAKDVYSFLAEWRQNSSLIRVPEPEHSERVKISTIHGVKGLEFPHVLLLWKEEKESFSVLPHPRERFPLSLTDRHTRDFLATDPMPGSREFAEVYAQASEARKKETANLLYVAATRAKQSLTILVRTNQDGDANGYSERLLAVARSGIDASIEPCAQRTVFGWECLYEPASPTLPVTDIQGPHRTLSTFRIVSPPPGPVLRELDPAYLAERIEAATIRGSRIHRVLSALSSDGKYPISELADERERKVLQAFLSHPEVQNILFRPGAVYTEQHLSDTNEFGIVDRLIVSPDRITLIDYKTGYRSPELLSQYRSQMERYRRMLSALFPGQGIEAYLLFVDDAENPVEVL